MHPHQEFAAASTVLVTSSLAGCWSERRFPNTGTLVTIALAALCSNLSLAPPAHFLYDLCWTTFLPASLVFLLISFHNNNKNNNQQRQGNNATISRDNGSSCSQKEVIRAVSVPFLMSCLGSIIGCVLSFLVCQKFPRLWLNPSQAAFASSCLCASFIGGTVNFFGVAKIITSREATTTLVSSMATADTLVMALYFSGLSLALQSKRLTKLFGGSSLAAEAPIIETDPVLLNHGLQGDEVDAKAAVSSRATILQTSLAGALATTIALAIVKLSSQFERLVAPILPGAACLAIALVSPAVQSILSSWSSSDHGNNNNNQHSLLASQIQHVSRYLSEFCLQLLFASIGTSCHMGRVLLQGSKCVWFSVLALSVHMVVAFLGSLVAKKWFQWPLFLEDVLIASNAAVGGPATAAAFAGRINSPRQRGLTMAATVWGITGYAVGTTIGVLLYNGLKQLL
ncbi:Protein of unknown function (DUF819) [Seminavis robusta]|uniref:Membrane protein YjcL n=1 Tax=Seminavis robusta TaxID=568900 RepID=A0A9N8DVQ0_9STRA|nr:Protein of unknown function (DUF819) [Seminavis robusta]|eukprot:Sro281_g107210.1 Protein of unknown function (DUF819) (455) ;mRNA; f:20343-21707